MVTDKKHELEIAGTNIESSLLLLDAIKNEYLLGSYEESKENIEKFCNAFFVVRDLLIDKTAKLNEIIEHL